MKPFRPPAVPLITVDPYFSIWSFADHLYDDCPRHWTGNRNAMTGLLSVDGTWYRFMGKVENNSAIYYSEPQILPQTDLSVMPAETIYRFENEKIGLTLTFMTPLLMDDLSLMSRPVSYVSYSIESLDKQPHDVAVFFDISAEASVSQSEQVVSFQKAENYISCGRGDQDVLTKSGDNLMIDWGYLYLVAPGFSTLSLDTEGKKAFLADRPYDEVKGSRPVCEGFVALCCTKTYSIDTVVSDFFCIAYDDLYSIEYFGEKLQAYWRKGGTTFSDLLNRAISEYATICERVSSFQSDLKEKAMAISEKYWEIVALAYRQAIAAHKLTWLDDDILFLSKECFSNGCIGTVDVTYPSIPLFLLYNPDLVLGMLNPIFKYANMKQWEYPFAPHDVGQYPLANGQVYGYDCKTREMSFYMQMPVEECGNMLLCTAAACHTKRDISYAVAHKELLGQWADYLVSSGWNHENQLCTDDFAGHLAHNCNLSIKAILGIAAWGRMLEIMGEPDKAASYTEAAKKYASAFTKAAFENNHYKLTFDQSNTWSIKYNLVWDQLLELNIFDPSIAKAEVNYYKTKVNQYGLPLDSRSDYTKSDWQMWSVALTKDIDYQDMIVEAMWNMLNETPDRVPFTDWYYTSSPKQVGFQNRTVQGGLFLPLCKF